ncbi:lysozyme inhibitor LprI family protein [Synechococcus sp. CS-1328]|uniref:lysozyme inhibitor LprI family protein n=1 Tax=Synechococcus sp. CS-1328 TaxID=2847976 RepID=UPI00223C175B|nr:lysozyme inhibitor LprI family protein [Synechococcus sp. CS-1328]MCT0224930.1 DUF1311 domain-containing protein [Synechococcus sp. CS-1328]
MTTPLETKTLQQETLQQSVQRRQAFPFRPDCNGNTQEMAACLWQERDQADQRLSPLLGGSLTLERWRSTRHSVCERSAQRGQGGSILPILWLECENTLNATLLQQLTTPLGR